MFNSDLLDKLIKQNKHLPDREDIFSLVDDYSLFCYYLKQDIIINQAILSPLRTEKSDCLPSFNIYPGRNGELRYHDHGTGKGGSVLDFIKELYGYTNISEVFARINEDFGLGFAGKEVDAQKLQFLKASNERLARKPIIDVVNFDKFSTEGLEYWKAYNVTTKILQQYQVNQVKYIILEGDIPVKIQNLGFSYRIGLKHKIYQPFETELKFRNNFPKTYVEGYYQLIQLSKLNQLSEVLFITKSLKDVMVLRSLGLDAIAPKAETQVIPDFIQDNLRSLYKYIVVMFDDDPAGHKGASRYTFPCIWVPKEDHVKDIADYIKKYGVKETKQLLRELLTN